MTPWIRIKGLFMQWHVQIRQSPQGLRVMACGSSFHRTAELEERPYDDPPREAQRCPACQGAYERTPR